jgi:hypothetical protein
MIPGTLSGKMMRQKICQLLAPSIRADFSSEPSIPDMNPRTVRNIKGKL